MGQRAGTRRLPGRRSRRAKLRLRPVDDREWLEVASASPQATFFHTPYWAQVAATAHPSGHTASVAAELSDGAVAVYPLYRIASGSGPVPTFSTFAGCYGGPVGARELTGAESAALHGAVLLQRPATLMVTLPPEAPVTSLPAGFQRSDDSTHVIDLRGKDFEEVLRGFQKRRREMYRRAARDGIKITVARDEAAVAEYWEVYEQTLSRWGERTSSRYPLELFRCLHELSVEQPDVVRLWRAEMGGVVYGGLWAFYWNGHVVAWHTANRSSQGFSSLLSLSAEVIRDAIERGCTRVDFNPSGGHTAAVEFKRRLGATELPLVRLHATHDLRGPSTLARRALARASKWRRGA